MIGTKRYQSRVKWLCTVFFTYELKTNGIFKYAFTYEAKKSETRRQNALPIKNHTIDVNRYVITEITPLTSFLTPPQK